MLYFEYWINKKNQENFNFQTPVIKFELKDISHINLKQNKTKIYENSINYNIAKNGMQQMHVGRPVPINFVVFRCCIMAIFVTDFSVSTEGNASIFGIFS